MAWAWDSHPEMLTGHVDIENSQPIFIDTIEINDFEIASPETAASHDHYCCCGNAHVVAIAVTEPVFKHCKVAQSEQAYRSALLNYIPSLPIKPPRI